MQTTLAERDQELQQLKHLSAVQKSQGATTMAELEALSQPTAELIKLQQQTAVLKQQLEESEQQVSHLEDQLRTHQEQHPETDTAAHSKINFLTEQNTALLGEAQKSRATEAELRQLLAVHAEREKAHALERSESIAKEQMAMIEAEAYAEVLSEQLAFLQQLVKQSSLQMLKRVLLQWQEDLLRLSVMEWRINQVISRNEAKVNLVTAYRVYSMVLCLSLTDCVLIWDG